MTTSKLCKDCRYYLPPASRLSISEYSLCVHPRFRSLVTGERDPRHCKIQRDTALEGYCGQEARYFEPRVEAAIEAALAPVSHEEWLRREKEGGGS